MATFWLRRALGLILMVVGMSALMFVVTHILPVDPARVAAGPSATEAQVAIVRQRLGLDRPLPIQYATYLAGLVRLDLGGSLVTGRPISLELAQALPITLELVIISFACIVAIAVPLGVKAAATRQPWVDGAIRLFALAGTGMAPFWLAILLQLLFYRLLGWLPPGGQIALAMNPPRHVLGADLLDSLLTANWQALASSAVHLVLPVAALVLGQLGILVRLIRVQVRLELAQDYVRSARAKGLAERRVVYRHALRNAWIPILTQIGIQFGYLLTGAVFVEGVFRLPGLGTYMLQAIGNLDFPALTAVALLISVIFVIINFCVDIAYTFIDPRVRLS